MTCILSLDVSSQMLEIAKNKKRDVFDNYSSTEASFKYVNKGIISLYQEIKKFNSSLSVELATFSDQVKIHSTDDIELFIKTFNEYKGCANLNFFFENIKTYVDEKYHSISVVNIVVLTLTNFEKFLVNFNANTRIFYVQFTDSVEKHKHEIFGNLRIFKTPFDAIEIYQVLNYIFCSICDLKRFFLHLADLKKCVGYLNPAPSNNLIKLWNCKKNSLVFETLGFLDQEDLVYCVTDNIFTIYINYDHKDKDEFSNILHLMKICLRRQRSSCIVSIGNGYYGVISSVRLKTSDQFVLYVPKCDLPWLGSWKTLGPLTVSYPNPYKINDQKLESSPFPLIEDFECSSYENDNNYLLTKPNFEADLSSLIYSLKTFGFESSNFLKNFEKFKNLCLLYGMQDLIQLLKKYLIDQISQFPSQDKHMILECFKNDEI